MSNRPYGQLKPVCPRALYYFIVLLITLLSQVKKNNFILYADDITLNSTAKKN